MPDMTTQTLNIGAHLTISKGIPQAMKLAHDLGATNFQYFPRNPRGGARREISESEISEGRQARVEFGIQTVICHLPYVVNPASPVEHIADFARMIVSEDIPFAAEMGADFVVLHPGAHMGEGVEAGIERVGNLFGTALAGYDGGAKVLFEGMSGSGTVLGSSPGEIAALIQAAGGHDWLGMCFDSCHLFAAGWDVTTTAGVTAMLAAYDDTVGLSRVGCMHLNDSKMPLGSRRDRHEILGRGLIGEAGIRALLEDDFIRGLPLSLETPVDNIRDYAAEISLVRKLAERA